MTADHCSDLCPFRPVADCPACPYRGDVIEGQMEIPEVDE